MVHILTINCIKVRKLYHSVLYKHNFHLFSCEKDDKKTSSRAYKSALKVCFTIKSASLKTISLF